MPLIPAVGKQRQVDLCGFKVSLVYRYIEKHCLEKPETSK